MYVPGEGGPGGDNGKYKDLGRTDQAWRSTNNGKAMCSFSASAAMPTELVAQDSGESLSHTQQPDIRCQRGHSGGERFPASSSPGGSGLGLFVSFSSLSSPILVSVRALVLGFRAHPNPNGLIS